MDDALINERKRIEELKMVNGKFRKENAKHKERKVRLDSLIQDSQIQNDQLKAEIRELLGSVEQMQAKLQQQESMINAKEDFLKRFRHQNEYLQSKKEVFDYLVVSLEVQQNQLVDYLNHLNSNLKKVHTGLIQEAETSKYLQLQREEIRGDVLKARTVFSNLGLEYRNLNQLAFRVVFRSEEVMADHSLTVPTFGEAIIGILNSSQTQRILQKRSGQERDGEVTDNLFDGKAKHEASLTTSKFIKTFKIERPLGLTLKGARVTCSVKDRGQEELFRKELGRVKNNFLYQLRDSSERYATMTLEKDRVVHGIQDAGAQLIKQSNQLRNERYLVFQRLYQQKQEAENITKEIASHNFREAQKRNASLARATLEEKNQKQRLRVHKAYPDKFGKRGCSQQVPNLRQTQPQPDYRNILEEAVRWNKKSQEKEGMLRVNPYQQTS